MAVVRKVEFQLKETTAAIWASKNPILKSSEPGVESDTGLYKMGDGVTPWNGLDYYIPRGKIAVLIAAAIADAALEGVSLGFEHVQSTPSSSWSIDVPPSLGRRPSVSIYDELGDLIFADVDATDTTVNITFPSPVSGSAVLS